MAKKTKYGRLAKRVEKQFERMSSMDSINGDIKIRKVMHGDYEVTIVGETHGTRQPYDFFRKEIQRQVFQNPHEWAFYLEGGDENKRFNANPGNSYIYQFGKGFRVPVYEATDPILYSEETRKGVMEKSEISEDKFYQCLLKLVLNARDDYRESLDDSGTQILIARDLNISIERAQEIIKLGPSFLSFERVVGNPWNELIKEKFPRNLERHPTRKKVYVNVGSGHLDAFLPE